MSPIEVRIRESLSNKRRVGPSVAATLVRLNKWVSSVQTAGLDAARVAVKAELRRKADFIESLAEVLIDHATGIDRKLLSKSLQEAFLYSVGFESDLTRAQFNTRFSRYVTREGAASFVVLFLSLYFFNFVWFEVGESFRALAWSSDSFLKDMESVERICRRVVTSVWRSFEQTQQLLDANTAAELVRTIDQRLRGIKAEGHAGQNPPTR